MLLLAISLTVVQLSVMKTVSNEKSAIFAAPNRNCRSSTGTGEKVRNTCINRAQHHPYNGHKEKNDDLGTTRGTSLLAAPGAAGNTLRLRLHFSRFASSG
jgi:hypothetical protein